MAFVNTAHHQADALERQRACGMRIGKLALRDDGNIGRNLEDLVQVLADDHHRGTGFGEVDECLPDAASRIRQALIDLAKAGSAVVVISQDLDEIFEVATNIAVISEGKLSDPHPAGTLTLERIGLMMGGIHESHSIPEAAHAH